jgi:DNA-directed RNA polymerase subunit RPC12/RpoP
MPKISEYTSDSDIKLDGFRCPKCGGDIFIMEVGLHCYYCADCGKRYAYSDEMVREVAHAL